MRPCDKHAPKARADCPLCDFSVDPYNDPPSLRVEAITSRLRSAADMLERDEVILALSITWDAWQRLGAHKHMLHVEADA